MKNELRLGNYINNYNKVIGIGQYLICEGLSFSGIVFIEDPKPIPLTEEWLFKFGFELINNNFYRSRNCELCLHWTVNKNKMLPEYYSNRLVTGYDFKYVHQLQNLYFALTNEELNINL